MNSVSRFIQAKHCSKHSIKLHVLIDLNKLVDFRTLVNKIWSPTRTAIKMVVQAT